MTTWLERVRMRVSDLIGGTRSSFRIRTNTTTSQFITVDASKPDYAYWDRARQGKVKGLELSGNMIKPVGSKVAAWVMGQTVDWRIENEYTEERMQGWWQRNHAHILAGYEESVHLGDCYLVINSDLSVAVLPPHVVSPLYDDDDLSKIVGWRIEQAFYDPAHPATKQIIVEEFTEKWRTRTVIDAGVPKPTKRYKNLIGRLPVIHIANKVGSDEIFGRPECHATIPLLQRYGDILAAAITGNIHQGRPTPVLERMGTAEAVRKFWEKFGRKERQTLPDGTTEVTDVIDMDVSQLMVIGGDGTFKFASPGPFVGEATELLNIMYYIYLQTTEIPEFVWGNAIGASKASSETQIEPFIKWLEKKRGNAQIWMNEVAQVVLAYMRLSDRRITKVSSAFFEWRPITTSNGQVALNAITWAFTNGLLDEQTALSLMPLRIVNPRDVLARARAEFDNRLIKPIQQDDGGGGDTPPAKQGHKQKDDARADDDDGEAAA